MSSRQGFQNKKIHLTHFSSIPVLEILIANTFTTDLNKKLNPMNQTESKFFRR